MGNAGSRADGPPWAESSARRTSGDTGAAIADYFFHAFPPASSLCCSFETKLCFSLVARGSGLERGDFYWATPGIVCTGRKCVKNWNDMVVLRVCCGGNTGSRLLVANGAWWDDLKMKWVWYAGTWHLKRMVKLYFLFSFVQRECILALNTKCVIIGSFESGSCLQNRSRTVCSSVFPPGLVWFGCLFFSTSAGCIRHRVGSKCSLWAALPGASPFVSSCRAAGFGLGKWQPSVERQTRDIPEVLVPARGKTDPTKIWQRWHSREVVLLSKVGQDRWKLKSVWVQKYLFSTY